MRCGAVVLSSILILCDLGSTWSALSDINKEVLLRSAEEYERIKYDIKRTTHDATNKTIRSSRHDDPPMGVPNINCDNGKVHLDVDWDPYSPASAKDYTCTSQRLQPVHKLYQTTCEKTAKPRHICMSSKLTTTHRPPLSGHHRPIWARYGEYTYIPWQRWLHNLEHGAVALLYNKCADPVDKKLFTNMLKNCLRKHIITPYDLPEETPFALVTWGCKNLFTHFDEQTAFTFIRQRALNGRENKVTMDGIYSALLIEPAYEPSDLRDSDVCPRDTFPKLRALEDKVLHSRHRNGHLSENPQKAEQLAKVNKKNVNNVLQEQSTVEDVVIISKADDLNRLDMQKKTVEEMIETEPMIDKEENLLDKLDKSLRNMEHKTELNNHEADMNSLRRNLLRLKHLFKTKVNMHL